MHLLVTQYNHPRILSGRTGSNTIPVTVFEEDLDQPIISQLQTTSPKDGVLLEILIYRSPYEASWTLKIQNNEGDSIVIGVNYDTDKDALDEAFKVLQEQDLTTLFSSNS